MKIHVSAYHTNVPYNKQPNPSGSHPSVHVHVNRRGEQRGKRGMWVHGEEREGRRGEKWEERRGREEGEMKRWVRGRKELASERRDKERGKRQEGEGE